MFFKPLISSNPQGLMDLNELIYTEGIIFVFAFDSFSFLISNLMGKSFKFDHIYSCIESIPAAIFRCCQLIFNNTSGFRLNTEKAKIGFVKRVGEKSWHKKMRV